MQIAVQLSTLVLCFTHRSANC